LAGLKKEHKEFVVPYEKQIYLKLDTNKCIYYIMVANKLRIRGTK